MTVRGLPAYTDYELCLTAKHGHGAAMSGHSEVNKVRTLRHGKLRHIESKNFLNSWLKICLSAVHFPFRLAFTIKKGS